MLNVNNLFELKLAKRTINGYTLKERKKFLTYCLRNRINAYEFNALLYMLTIDNRITLGIYQSRDLNYRLVDLVEKCTSKQDSTLLFEYKIPVSKLTNSALNGLRRAAYVVPPSVFQFMIEQYLSQIIKE
jgi:hypothetical protein